MTHIRPRILACLALAGLAVAGAPAATANAVEPGPAAGDSITHPDRDFMGWSHRGTAEPGEIVTPNAVTQTPGIDVSSYQGNVNWASQWGAGVKFAWVKATEGTSYTNPYFSQQYGGSYDVGMIRGAYHFASPNGASGATQASYFVSHGGGWSKDGKTLPGVLDIEYNPYGATCYGISKSAMVSWIKSFTTKYKSLTGRDAVIYTTTDWWTTCTGNSSAFGATNPLWIARYASSAGTLPAGWGFHTIWQYTSSPLDKDKFNGDLSRVKALANG